MPEDQLTPKEDSDPSENVRKTLDGILGWVQKKKVQATNPDSKVTKSSPWGWVVGLVAAVLIFFALAFLAWRAWKKGREIAKLKHQLDLKKEEEFKIKVNATIHANKKQRKQLESKAASLATTVKKIKNDLKKAEEERKLAHSTIDEITSWEDVDKIVGEPDASYNQPSDPDIDSGSSVE